jgi:hypothetical protein
MNSAGAAFGPRPQPAGSAQPAATRHGRPTARRGVAREWAAVSAASRSLSVVSERHGWWGKLKGASSIAPSKEIGAAAHPSGRSMLRWRHRLGGGTHRW